MPHANHQHGQSHNGSKAYSIWKNMRRRCNSPENPAYADYGGRGIKVCPEWDKFPAFLRDMGHPPPGHTLDRKENDQGYNPTNCRWATRKEQARNRRSSVFLTAFGKRQTLAGWAEEYRLRMPTLWKRLRDGWPLERALVTPLQPRS